MELGVFPTPLHRVSGLGPPGLADLWLKRDDLSGFAWGGNKVRTVGAILADIRTTGADTVIVAGAPGSNFAALLAVACGGSGLRVHQVCHGSERSASALALARRAGATVLFTGEDDKDSMDRCAGDLARILEAAGRRAYVVPRGGATPVGAQGFALAAAELLGQLGEHDHEAVTVVLPVGSGGSIAGLLAGLAIARPSRPLGIVGISVTRAPDRGRIEACARATVRLLAGPEPHPLPGWRLVDGRTGEAEAGEVAGQVLRHAGFAADPVYNAKALHWLAHHRAEVDGSLVYWATGGLLAAADELTQEGST